LSDVARAVSASPSHCERLLREKTGVTFRTHLRRARMNEAARLLAHTLLSTKEVAGRVSYSQASALCRDFRAAFGTTPKEWRRRPTEVAVALPALASPQPGRPCTSLSDSDHDWRLRVAESADNLHRTAVDDVERISAKTSRERG
jgi:AraC-like DNA-binding protein